MRGYVPHTGYHWHEGVGHDHEHELVGHHGPPFGKRRVIEVPDAPDYTLVLKASIDRIKEQRDGN